MGKGNLGCQGLPLDSEPSPAPGMSFTLPKLWQALTWNSLPSLALTAGTSFKLLSLTKARNLQVPSPGCVSLSIKRGLAKAGTKSGAAA